MLRLRPSTSVRGAEHGQLAADPDHVPRSGTVDDGTADRAHD
jgi:hypothetical protein